MARRRQRNSGSSGGTDILLLAGVGFLLYSVFTKSASATSGPLTTSQQAVLNTINANNAAAISAQMYPGVITAPPTVSSNVLLNPDGTLAFGMNGLGRVYLSGMGMIGAGYGINETFAGDASRYEKARKFVL